MVIPINLAHELADHDPRTFKSIPNAFMYHDQTPAHNFTTVIAPIHDGQYCIVLPSRDYFDEYLAAAVLQFVTTHASSFLATKPLLILEEFLCGGHSFDSIAVLSPSAAKQYEHENDLLNQRSFVVFPMYRCEFSGDESAELIDLIRHDFLPSLDWKRSPCPKISMAFQNKTNNTRSTGNKLGLTTLAAVLAEVANLAGAEKSWIKLENFLRQQCRIEWNADKYDVTLPDEKTIRLDELSVIELVIHFASRRVEQVAGTD